MLNNYLGVIPARGGSKRLPGKNIRLLNGKALIIYSIEAALSSERLAEHIVSTDDEMIAACARENGGNVPFIRPAELAQDSSSSIEVLLHALQETEKEMNIDALVLLQPTSPFRTSKHIDEAISLFESSGADTVISVCHPEEHPYYTWKMKDDHFTPFFSMKEMTCPRHELPESYIVNGGIYIVKKEYLKQGKIYGQKIVPYVMDRQLSVDIDSEEDFLLAEYLLNRKTNG